MPVPTITGKLVRIDDSVHVGDITIVRVSTTVVNGGSLVVLTPLTISTATDGTFSTKLHPGEYEIDAAVSRYQGVPYSKLRFKVPNVVGPLAFDTLSLNPPLPTANSYGT